MTAINAVRYSDDLVMLYTDTAAYDREGKVLFFEEKTFEVVGMGVTVAFAGTYAFQSGLKAMLESGIFRDIDHLADHGEDGLFEGFVAETSPIIRDVRTMAGNEEPLNMAVCIAGWSEDDAAMKLLVYSTNIGFHVNPKWFAAPLSEEVRSILSAPDFTAGKDGVRLLEAQRRDMLDDLDKPASSTVGGHGTCTIVNRAGSQQVIIKRWDGDKAGQRIRSRPHRPSVPAPIPPAGLNRSQRRAFEKMHRR